MTGIILLLASLMAIQDPGSDRSLTDDEVRAISRRQATCLLNEVSSRVRDQAEITEQLRSVIRVAAADACFENDRALAAQSREVRDGARTLDDVTAEMVTLSLGIADANVTVLVEANRRTAQRAQD